MAFADVSLASAEGRSASLPEVHRIGLRPMRITFRRPALAVPCSLFPLLL